MAAHSGTKIKKEGLVFQIDMDHDSSYAGAPAENLCPESKRFPTEEFFVYSGTGYGVWSHYTTWDSLGVADQEYITISGEIKVSNARKNSGGQGRMYIWTASATDGWIRSSSQGVTSTEWTPFKVTLQRRNSADTTTSSNTGNSDPIYCRFGFYHYPNSKNIGKTFLRNVMINVGSEALPFAHDSRLPVLKDLKGNKDLTIKDFTKSSIKRFGNSLKTHLRGKYLPRFDGGTSYVPIQSWPSHLNVDDNSTPRSWEVICRTDSTDARQGIFGHKVGSGCSYYCNGGLYIWDGSFIFNWYDNSSYRYLNSGVSAQVGKYYHVIGTFDSDRLTRIYVNGELRAVWGSETNLNYGGGMLYVEKGYNSKSGGQHFFSGEIPVAKFYKGVALSETDALLNYYAYKARFGI